jgi:hypothetical protein
LLAQVRWFSLGTPASSTTKTGHHDIAGILLKVALLFDIYYKNVQMYVIIFTIIIRWNEYYFMKKGK